MGVITLLVTVRMSPCQITNVVDFLIVDCPSTYNAILGKPMLNKMKAVTSTYHLLIHFLTEEGVGEVRGDQAVA